MRILLLATCLLAVLTGLGQSRSAGPKHIDQPQLLVKANVLNLVALGPAGSVEWLMPKGYGVELAYAGGRLGEGHHYSGVQLRAKKYLEKLKLGEFVPFAGIYAGTLRRERMRAEENFFVGTPYVRELNFTAQSFRFGGLGGGTFFLKNRWVLEALGGLGYGVYTSMNNRSQSSAPRGYVNVQVWASVGYRL